ncbi:Inner membrane protein yejM [Raoultella ornithinolytica]|nr:Inner membrane protein yejM [Raoultella ornithinolytica]
MARDWQLMFISVPIIFLLEMLFATWSWQKLRSLTRRRPLRPACRLVFLSLFYQQPPDLYLGGCEFLSPDHHATGESAALLSDDGPPFP